MSIGEDLAEPSENDAEAFNVIEGLKRSSETLERAIGVVTTAPTREAIDCVYSVVEEAKAAIRKLYDSDFFRNSEKDLLVSQAVSAYVENLKGIYVCRSKLSSKEIPMVLSINPLPIQGAEDIPPLKVPVSDRPDTIGQQNRAAEIDEMADRILQGAPEVADRLSGILMAVGNNQYDNLLNEMALHPVTKKFLEKEARKERIKESAIKAGEIAVPVFVATFAANVAKDYLFRSRK